MAATFVLLYLTAGTAAALLFFRSVRVGIAHRDSHAGDPHVRCEATQALDSLERTISRLPGGMSTALLATVLLWPGLLVAAVANGINLWRGRSR